MCYRREQTKGKQIVTLRILWHQILLDIWHNGELFRRASWTNSHPLQESTPQSFSRSSLGADRRFDVIVPLQTEHGATQGTLRYDPISRRRPPDNFRFQYWPWQFPDKIDFQPLSSTLCRPKISGSADYGKSRGE